MRCYAKKKMSASAPGPRLTALPKSRNLTQVQLAEATKTTQRSVSYSENGDGVLPSFPVMIVAQALKVSALSYEDPETSRIWNRFQIIMQLPENDQRVVNGLIYSLAAVGSRRNNGAGGVRNGR